MKFLGEADNVIQDFISEYERLDVDYKDKIMLNISANVYIPDKRCDKSTVCRIVGLSGDNVIFRTGNLKAHRSYPNKNILNAAMNYDRKRTKNFIPFSFDSLSELRKVNKIVILWYICSRNTYPDEFMMMEYDVDFRDIVQDGCYNVYSYDIPFCDNVSHEVYTEYDDVCMLSYRTDIVTEKSVCCVSYEWHKHLTENTNLSFDINDIFDKFENVISQCGWSDYSAERSVHICYYHQKVSLTDNQSILM